MHEVIKECLQMINKNLNHNCCHDHLQLKACRIWFAVLRSAVCHDASLHFHGFRVDRPFTFTHAIKIEFLIDIIHANKNALIVRKEM